MGHKVHPFSMRLQVHKNWSSMWFAPKRDYVSFLSKDLKARAYISKTLGTKAQVSKVDIERTHNSITITIQTAKAGVVIGKGGSVAQELKKQMELIYGFPVRVNIEEIKKPELQAKLVAENIASQIERRIAFRRAMKQTAAATMRGGAKGIRIQLSGRLGGAEMSRKEKMVEGSVPLHTIRADIDYSYARATYPGSGIIGVKVWIYKGEANY
jgi:small subunit ribosomal protein S3